MVYCVCAGVYKLRSLNTRVHTEHTLCITRMYSRHVWTEIQEGSQQDDPAWAEDCSHTGRLSTHAPGRTHSPPGLLHWPGLHSARLAAGLPSQYTMRPRSRWPLLCVSQGLAHGVVPGRSFRFGRNERWDRARYGQRLTTWLKAWLVREPSVAWKESGDLAEPQSPQPASGDHPVRGQERRPERTASRLPAGGVLACDHTKYTVAAQSARRARMLLLRRGQRASSEALDGAGLTVSTSGRFQRRIGLGVSVTSQRLSEPTQIK